MTIAVAWDLKQQNKQTKTNSADPDEMPPYAAFHLGLHCLPKYLFTGIQTEKGNELHM